MDVQWGHALVDARPLCDVFTSVTGVARPLVASHPTRSTQRLGRPPRVDAPFSCKKSIA